MTQGDDGRPAAGTDGAGSDGAGRNEGRDDAPPVVPPPPPTGTSDDAGAPHPELTDPRPASRSSRRKLVIAGAAAGLVLLVLVGGLLLRGGGGAGFNLERNELLLLTSARSEGRVDVYVVGLDDDPSPDNRVLRDVRLRRIDIPGSLDFTTTTFLGLPVRGGFLVHVETQDDDYAVMFVGTDGEDSVIELFDSGRMLDVVYAPGIDRLLIRESGDTTDRCYLGGAREPAARIGSGETCWLGIDGTIAIADLTDGVLEIEFHDASADEVTTVTLDDVADADGWIGRLSWMTGLWSAPAFFAYVAVDGPDGRALVHVDPRTGEEVYRSAAYRPDDLWLLAGGLRIGAVLSDEYVTMRLLATDDRALVPVADGSVVFVEALASGDLLFATGDVEDAQSGWRDRSLDVHRYRPDADETERIAEQVGEWYVLDALDRVELLLLDARDAVLLDLGSGARREVLDTRDIGEVVSVLRHVEGGTYVWSIDDDGWRVDRVGGAEPWEVVSRWSSVMAFHVDPRSGWHVVQGREAAGDDVTLAVAQPGDRRVQRVDRAESIGALYVAGPGRLIYSASTPRDEEVRQLDIEEGESTTLHRGYALAAAGLPRSSDGFVLSGSLPLRGDAELFAECAENFRGTITGAEQLDLTFEAGEEAACWRWDVSGLSEPVAWLHAGEVYGFFGVVDRRDTFGWATESGSLFDVVVSGTLLEAPGLSEAGGPWFLYVEPYDADGRVTTTLETGDAALGMPTSHLFPYATGCDPTVTTERAAQCLLESFRVLDALDDGDDWASVEVAASSLRSLLGLLSERDLNRFGDLYEQQPDLEFIGCQRSIRLGFGESCFFTSPIPGSDNEMDPAGIIEVEVDRSSFARYRFSRILKW